MMRKHSHMLTLVHPLVTASNYEDRHQSASAKAWSAFTGSYRKHSALVAWALYQLNNTSITSSHKELSQYWSRSSQRQT